MHTSKMVTRDSNGSLLAVLFFLAVGFVACSVTGETPSSQRSVINQNKIQNPLQWWWK